MSENETSKAEMLSEEDKKNLEIAKLNRQLVLTETEKHLARNEASENAYKLFLFQLFMKYGMDPSCDSLSASGEILRNNLNKENTE